jgi:hypothetical protein
MNEDCQSVIIVYWIIMENNRMHDSILFELSPVSLIPAVTRQFFVTLQMRPTWSRLFLKLEDRELLAFNLFLPYQPFVLDRALRSSN